MVNFSQTTVVSEIASTYEIPMNCRKFHMTCDVTLLLSTGISECQQYSHKLNQCLFIEQQAQCQQQLSCHTYIVCGGFHSCQPTHAQQQFACLSVVGSWLLLTVSAIIIIYMYILYLRHENVIVAILCTGLLITTTLSGEYMQ